MKHFTKFTFNFNHHHPNEFSVGRSCAILLMCDTLATKYLLRFVVYSYLLVTSRVIYVEVIQGIRLWFASPNSLRQTRKLAEHAM